MNEVAGEWVGILPWLLPVTAIALLLAVWLSRPLARTIRARTAVAAGMIVSLGLILGATLTPLGVDDETAASERRCDLSRVELVSLGDMRRLNDAALNVLLFVPLGAAVGLVPGRRQRLVLLAGAAVLPVGIEGVQLAVSALGRGCQASDVIDNVTGLGAGFVAGSVVHFLVRRL